MTHTRTQRSHSLEKARQASQARSHEEKSEASRKAAGSSQSPRAAKLFRKSTTSLPSEKPSGKVRSFPQSSRSPKVSEILFSKPKI